MFCHIMGQKIWVLQGGLGQKRSTFWGPTPPSTNPGYWPDLHNIKTQT